MGSPCADYMQFTLEIDEVSRQTEALPDCGGPFGSASVCRQTRKAQLWAMGLDFYGPAPEHKASLTKYHGKLRHYHPFLFPRIAILSPNHLALKTMLGKPLRQNKAAGRTPSDFPAKGMQYQPNHRS
jgi:hypothetical protein